MSTVRKLRPPKRPETLAELVLDFDSRFPGDADAAIELPAQEWAHLVSRATLERELGGPASDAELISWRSRMSERSHAVGIEDARAAGVTPVTQGEVVLTRTELADALGWGSVNSAEELLQVVRGYVMALEIERAPEAQMVDNVLSPEAATEVRAILNNPTRPTTQTLEEWFDGDLDPARIHPECGHPAEAHFMAVAHPKGGCVRSLACPAHGKEEPAAPTIIERSNKDLMEESGRLLNGAGWKRTAKHARETNSTAACHHCGAEADDEARRVKNSDDLPNGTFCPGCVLRLRANPREWDRHSAPPKTKAEPKPKLIDWDNAWDSTLLCERARTLGMTDLYKRMLGHTPHERRPAYKEAHELYLAGKLGDPPAPKKGKKKRTANSKVPATAEVIAAPEKSSTGFREYSKAEGRTFWDGTGFTKPPEGSEGGEAEVYCRNCKAYFPAGTHTHAVAPKAKRGEQLEIGAES